MRDLLDVVRLASCVLARSVGILGGADATRATARTQRSCAR